MPRPSALRRFSWAVGLGTDAGSKPTLVLDDYFECVGLKDEVHAHAFALVLAVAVFDGVDDRLPDRDAHVVGRLLAEADHVGEVRHDGLDHLEHLEAAGDVEFDRSGFGRLHLTVTRPCGNGRAVQTVTRGVRGVKLPCVQHLEPFRIGLS